MITVVIYINGNPIFTRSGVNRTKHPNDTHLPQPYEIDSGQIIAHIPDIGAVELAKKMLDTIKEPKEKVE